MTMANESALATTEDVEALADRLSAAADGFNENLKALLRAGAIDEARAYALLHDEQTLRTQANALYFQAAQRVVTGLTVAQADMLETIGEAAERLKKISDLRVFLDLAADLIAFAAAASSGKPKVIVAALKEVRNDIKAVGSARAMRT
jgi:uncharacterized protein YgfB (UPF0149 family)